MVHVFYKDNTNQTKKYGKNCAIFLKLALIELFKKGTQKLNI
jgi:hypothetical protein